MRYPRSIRLTRDAYRDVNTMFHLVVHAHARFQNWPPLVTGIVWGTLMEEVVAGRASLVLCCLMPDHVHLLGRPGTRNLTAWVGGFKSLTTHRFHQAGGHGAVWQRGMWDRTVRGTDDLRSLWSYIVANPVRAGLCGDPLDWPWLWYAPEWFS